MTTSEAPVLEAPPDPFDPPPREGIWDALRSHPVVAVLPVILFVGAAVALALTRSPTYTAEAKLAVGPVDVTSPGLPGLVVASQSLATVYSRAIDARRVTAPVARRLHTERADVASRLSASPVPESPVFRVRARADSSEAAIRLANLGSESLIDYTRTLSASREERRRLLRRYRAAAEDLGAAVADRDRLRARRASERSLIRAGARVEEERLRAEALKANYRRASEQGQAHAELVTVLAPASSATSDRTSKLQLWAGAALAAGLLLGAALAIWRAARLRDRWDY